MTIIVKNKHTLLFKDFKFRCCIGKNNFSKKKLRVIKKLQLEYLVWEISTIELTDLKNHLQV